MRIFIIYYVVDIEHVVLVLFNLLREFVFLTFTSSRAVPDHSCLISKWKLFFVHSFQLNTCFWGRACIKRMYIAIGMTCIGLGSRDAWIFWFFSLHQWHRFMFKISYSVHRVIVAMIINWGFIMCVTVVIQIEKKTHRNNIATHLMSIFGFWRRNGHQFFVLLLFKICGMC